MGQGGSRAPNIGNFPQCYVVFLVCDRVKGKRNTIKARIKQPNNNVESVLLPSLFLFQSCLRSSILSHISAPSPRSVQQYLNFQCCHFESSAKQKFSLTSTEILISSVNLVASALDSPVMLISESCCTPSPCSSTWDENIYQEKKNYLW